MELSLEVRRDISCVGYSEPRAHLTCCMMCSMQCKGSSHVFHASKRRSHVFHAMEVCLVFHATSGGRH